MVGILRSNRNNITELSRNLHRSLDSIASIFGQYMESSISGSYKSSISVQYSTNSMSVQYISSISVLGPITTGPRPIYFLERIIPALFGRYRVKHMAVDWAHTLSKSYLQATDLNKLSKLTTYFRWDDKEK